MRTTVAAVLMALTIPAMWAQKYPKGPGNSPFLSRTDRQPMSLHVRAFKPKSKAVPRQVASGPAAGVVQMHAEPSSGSLVAYFINTVDLPGSTTITGTITRLDDGSVIDLDQVPISAFLASGVQVLPAGSTFVLPEVSFFGNLWEQDTFDYSVELTTASGVTTQADGFVSIGEALAFSDLASSEPVMASTTQRIASNGDVIVAIGGYFTTDQPLVVMGDLFANYVVPASAINRVSGSEIDIDLSQVQGLDLTLTDELLLTVSQAGFADTMVYRYVPAAPGTFNLAPQ